MRLQTMLLATVAALMVCVAIYYLTGGRFVFFALPLVFALPLLGRRRR
jgi:hypothetical protein